MKNLRKHCRAVIKEKVLAGGWTYSQSDEVRARSKAVCAILDRATAFMERECLNVDPARHPTALCLLSLSDRLQSFGILIPFFSVLRNDIVLYVLLWMPS